jgi:hypothetical protein
MPPANPTAPAAARTNDNDLSLFNEVGPTRF